MKKLTFSILIIMLIIGITVIPVNAEVFDKTYEDSEYAYWQADLVGGGGSYPANDLVNKIVFTGGWTDYEGLYYIGLDLPVGVTFSGDNYQNGVTTTLKYSGTTYGIGSANFIKQYEEGAYSGLKILIHLDSFDAAGLQSAGAPLQLDLAFGSETLYMTSPRDAYSVTKEGGDSSLLCVLKTSANRYVPGFYVTAKESGYKLDIYSDYIQNQVNDITINSNGQYIYVVGKDSNLQTIFTHNSDNEITYSYHILPLNVTSYLPDGQVISDIIGEGITPTSSINVDIDKGSNKQSEDTYSIIKTSSASYNYPEDIIVETTNIPEETISTIGYYLFDENSGILKDGYTYYLLINDSYRKQKYDIDTSQYTTIEMISSDSISSEIDEITFDMENLDSGHYEVRARFTGYPTTYISGIGYAGEVASTYDITLHIRDAISQSGISGEYILSEYNPETDILEEIGSGNFAGSTTWKLKPETQYSWDFESTGYRNREFNLLATGDVQRIIYMYPEGSNYTLGFSVYETINGKETGVYGAKIDIDGRVIYSNSMGNAGIELPTGNYSYSVNAEGYTSHTGSVYVDEDMFVSVKLSPTGGEITPTPTPTPFNIDKPTNIIESVKYAFAKMFGFDGTNPEKINLLFALIIITGTASLAGTITRRGEEFISGTGVLIGAGIGFVFCIALDLIPLWILFVGIAGLIGYILFISQNEG